MANYNFKLFGSSVLLLTSLFFVSCKKDNDSNLNNSTEVLDSNSQLILVDLLDDERFFSEATALGVERASKPEIKEFSEKANALHEKNLETIKTIFKDHGVEISENLPKDFNDKLYKLTVSNTADFDNYFYQSMLKDYNLKLDSLAKLINENSFENAQDILMQVSVVYNKNLEELDKLK